MAVQMKASNVNSEREEIAEVYIAMMEQIVRRADAMAHSLDEVRANPGHEDNWKNAEFLYLQARRLCEYLAVAILAAHREYEGADAKGLSKEWHAATLIQKVGDLNPYAFPVPIEVHFDHWGLGRHHVDLGDVVMSADDLASIYGKSGDRLHVGSLGKIVRRRLSPYDIGEIAHWRNLFVRTLNTHMIRLPHIGSVMLIHLKDESDGKIHCAFGDAEGDFGFEGDTQIFDVKRIL